MLKNWDDLFKKYNVHYEGDILYIANTAYPKHFVEILEAETLKIFKEVTDDNAEVVLCFQLAILAKLRGDK